MYGRGKPLTALAKAVGAAVGGLGSLETVESQLRQGGLPELLGGHLPEDTGMVMVIDPLCGTSGAEKSMTTSTFRGTKGWSTTSEDFQRRS